jgi:inosine-uridine nucleoside N-ribohydrolase
MDSSREIRRRWQKTGLFGLVFLTAALAFANSASARSSQKQTVIISTDAGCDVDDQIEIVHALLSPEISVAGIVSTHAPNLIGNDIPINNKNGVLLPLAEITANQVRLVFKQLPPQSACPLFVGSSKPLVSKTSPLSNKGVQFILDTSSAFNKQQRLVLISIGAATDIGSALILDPTLADRIEVVALGFESWPRGGDGFNIRNDVKAWQIIMDSNVPVTVADGAVSKRDLAMDKAKSANVFYPHGSVGRFLDGLVTKWLARNGTLTKKMTGRDAWPIWDEATTAYLLGLAQTKVYARPTLLDDTTFKHGATKKTIRWITSVDAGKLWLDLDNKMDKVGR